MDFAQTLTEDRRLVILRLLAQAPSYTANLSILHSAMSSIGHRCSRDQVAGDLAWLTEQGLLETETIDGIVIATATQRGVDVAEARVTHPGVKRPSPGH